MEDEICITGMSGRFPAADSVAEYWEKLCNKVDFITEDGRRWKPGTYGLPKRMGLLKEIDKFDNLYFGINHRSAHELDPQARILLEVVDESIVDAGYDPETLKGKNIGVFIGASSGGNDSLVLATEDLEKFNGYALVGYTMSVIANRISYAFDFKGPSMVVDTACASGAVAFYHAVKAIGRGDCDAAIVGSTILHLKPEHALSFKRLKMISEEGKCKSFDTSADGYAKSEAVVSLFIQRSNDARRNYASIVNTKTNTDGYKIQGFTFPAYEMQKCLMRDCLKGADLDPSEISYFEAHAPGTKAGDPVEIAAIRDVYCCDRKNPLLMGSVKSNIGHTEVASGLCSIIKVLLAMEKGLLPPNLHLKEPIPELKPLLDKQIKVITELTPWNGTYAALNCFGFGGINVNFILKRPVLTPKKEQEKNVTVPKIIFCCGRTEDSVQSVFESDILKNPNREFLALFHKLAYSSPKKRPYRGYKIPGIKECIQDIKLLPFERRPIWYVFSGMGTQWPAMAKDLMKIETFRNSIRKSEEILKPHVPDLMDILTNECGSDTSTKNNANNKQKIIPVFVSIAALQIALVDVLDELGLKPDGIVGHSVGELGCAYADGCFTAEQMLLAAYWRGKAAEDSDLIQGSMAATGMTWSEAQKRCPEDIYPACHNAEDSVTISGPVESMKRFMGKLKSENAFVREVNSCGYAFHCNYVLPIADKLQLHMEKLITEPKQRSSRWISSSYPEDKWKTPGAQHASASYFVHNLVSPVLFHDALRHIPKNAVVIEIGPHHLLQAILKREIGTEAVHIGLMKRNADNILHLLSSIGKMYTAGLDIDIEKLYRPVLFPVPRNTAMISPLIKWDHSATWTVPKWDIDAVTTMVHYEVDTSSIASEDHYLLGHCIDGRTLFPAAGYLVLVWKTLSKIEVVENLNVLPVAFENVKFIKATLLSEKEKTKFKVLIAKTTGYFEISEKGTAVCTGFVSTPTEKDKKNISKDITVHKDSLTLSKKDIYKDLWLKGYEYGPTFQGIKASNFSGSEGILNWNDNWISYMDTLFQFTILSVSKRKLLIATEFESLIIDPMQHGKYVETESAKFGGMPVTFLSTTKELFAPGFYVKNLKNAYQKRRPVTQRPLLEEYRFIPYIETCCLSENKKILLNDYNSVCLYLSQKISNLSINGKQSSMITENCSDVDVDKYLKSDANEYVLLKCLFNIINNFKGHDIMHFTKEWVSKYLCVFENDILHKGLLDEYILRPISDIVIENTRSKALKVLEITDGCSALSTKVNEYIAMPALTKISCSILHPKGDFLSKDQLAHGTEIINWDYNSYLGLEDVDLVVLNFLRCSLDLFIKTLKNAVGCLKDEGFLILLVKSRLTESEIKLSKVSELSIPTVGENDVELLSKDMNLQVICKKSDSFTSTLFLLRKQTPPLYKDLAIPMKDGEYAQWIDILKKKMIQAQISTNSNTSERLWLVSEDSQQSGIIGLVNCIRLEPGGSNVRCIFIGNKPSNIPEFSLTNPFYKEQLKKNLVMNVLYSGVWGSYRHIRLNEDSSVAETEHAYLEILTIGDLSTLQWIHSSMKYVTSRDNVAICHVYYASLNFKDVMIATGRVSVSSFSGGPNTIHGALGFEFSGRLSDGRRVMGITTHMGVATSVAANPLLLWSVPNEWSLEEAATVPCVYATVYYALILRGRLKKGEKILIHSGSGGVGQAAITIALNMGCDVYTTVGSNEKKEFLKKKFPELQEDHFSNSRDTSFEKDILNATNGIGVDVVLNSLSEEKLFASLNCLACNGRFLEIGKYDLANNSKLGMAFFLKNVSFHGIFLDTIFSNCGGDSETVKEIRQLIENGIAAGIVKPLNTTVFNYDEAQKAFRYMASGQHIGKVVLKIRVEEKDRTSVPSPIRIKALRQTICDPKKSYILIGGLGGIGLELCHWLIERGAKNLVLSSRSGITTEYQRLCLQRWEKESIKVELTKLNAVKPNDAKEIIMLASKLGSVGGIFNVAMVLKDALMVNQSVQNYIDVCEPKIDSTKNLDFLSRKLCPELDWFVCFSSVACGRGIAAKSNYAYANSVMERICEERVNEGLPGLAIQWGAVDDVGFVNETMGSGIIVGDTFSQRIRSCLIVFEKFLQQRLPVVSSLVPYELSKDARKNTKDDLMAFAANIFGIDHISAINPETSLSELGMDSLTAVDLRQILESNFDTSISLSDMRNLKVKDLKKIANQSSSKDTEIEQIDIQNFFGEFNVLTSEDLIFSEAVIHMNSTTGGPPLFIIHSLEGTVAALKDLAKLLPCPVYGIQFTAKSPQDTLENLASFYWKLIKDLNIPKEKLTLAGYSQGAMITFEMALQAEQDPNQYPEIQNIFLLEGSHSFGNSYFHSIAASFDEALSDPKIQIAALRLFAAQFPHNINLDKTELLKLDNFPERIQYTFDKITAAFPDIKPGVIETVFGVLAIIVRMSVEYTPKYTLKKDVYLIKASRSITMATFVSDLYDLEKVCEGKITAHTVEGTHQSFIQGRSLEEIARIMKGSLN